MRQYGNIWQHRGRQVFDRLLLVLLGTLFALLLLEFVLQAGALVIRLSHATSPPSWKSTTRRLLALGDSNTYGLYLTRNDAYPAVLKDLLQQLPNAGQVEVINLGYPGCNSSKLRNELPRLLRTFAPDVVTVMIGVNDFWTVSEPIETTGSADSWAQRLWRLSRVYRLAYMVTRAMQRSTARHEPEVEIRLEEGPPDLLHPKAGGQMRVGNEIFDLSWKKGAGNRQWQKDLYENLEVMSRDAKAYGTTLVFLTYAADDPVYGVANAVIRSAAQVTATPLVDVTPVFAPQCPHWRCDELLFADHHPTAKGHQLIARTVLRALLPDGERDREGAR